MVYVDICFVNDCNNLILYKYYCSIKLDEILFKMPKTIQFCSLFHRRLKKKKQLCWRTFFSSLQFVIFIFLMQVLTLPSFFSCRRSKKIKRKERNHVLLQTVEYISCLIIYVLNIIMYLPFIVSQTFKSGRQVYSGRCLT